MVHDHGRTRMLIAVEGIDGSGKTTIATQLIQDLKKLYSTIEVVRDGGYITTLREGPKRYDRHAKKLAKELLGSTEYYTDMQVGFLNMADFEHTKGFLEDDNNPSCIVVNDRHLWSTLAYGFIHCKDDNACTLAAKEALREYMFNRPNIVPDLTIYVDATLDLCMQHLTSRGESLDIIYERRELQKMIQSNYEDELANYAKLKLAYEHVTEDEWLHKIYISNDDDYAREYKAMLDWVKSRIKSIFKQQNEER